MNPLDRLSRPITAAEDPLLCLEVNPPRGVEVNGVYERLDGNLEGVDYLNVTDSALARMRFSPLPFASLLKARYNIETLVNISCRDRNLIAIQGDLLAGWTTGVRSIIALTGDAVTIGDSPERKGVFEVNSVGLLNVISSLNSGKDISGNELKGAPDYVPGVVVNPNAKNIAPELRRLQKKKDAGARYALSQPVFEESVADQFFTEAAALGMPILVGLLPFKSAAAIKGISSIPGIRISPEFVARAEAAGSGDISTFSIDHCLKLAERTKGMVRGFHVISGATPKLGLRLVSELKRHFALNRAA